MATNIMRFVIPKSLVQYITAESTVRQALEKMLFHKYSTIPVIEKNGEYVGTLRSDDVFRYFMEAGHFDKSSAEDIPVTNIMRSSAKPLFHTSTIKDLIEEVKEHNSVSVVDDRGVFIGLILRRDVLNFLLKDFKDE